MIITIPGKPIAKARPRFVRRGKFVATYNPQETEEGRWLLSARSQITEKLTGPIKIRVIFFMPIPKMSAKKLLETMGSYHQKKPDIDNLLKFVLDCLNGEAWEDDALIGHVEALKFYDIEPSTKITLGRAL
jgi:Holliday junction resolvase RusA-like endonuclease